MKKITLKISAFLFVALSAFQVNAQDVVEYELEKVYNIRNVATNKYLSSDETNQGVAPVDYTEDLKLNFIFRNVEVDVEGVTKTVQNIVSQVKGALRGAGAGAGNKVFNTGKKPTTTDSDKVWQVVKVNDDPVRYRFFAGKGDNPSRYMREMEEATDAGFILVSDLEEDDRGLWELELSEIEEAPASTNDFTSDAFSISNPINNELTIKGATSKVNEISLYSILGGKMLTKVINTQSAINLDVSSLAAGLYIVELKGDTGRFTQKLIKQ